MRIFANVVLPVPAAVLLMGVIAERGRERRRDVTMAFIAVMATLIAVNTVM